MDAGSIAAVISCTLACGGILIYIGRSLGALESIKRAVEIALVKTDVHEKEISAIKEKLAKVETRQEDCNHCP